MKSKSISGRQLTPLNDVDADDGPAMKALPTDRHRLFVRALFAVKPGRGANTAAATMAGFGKPDSTKATMHTIASRLSLDARVIAAIQEVGQRYIRAGAPHAIHAMSSMIANPKHRDHARMVAFAITQAHPMESVHRVAVEHSAAPSLQATAEVLGRIAEMAARLGIDTRQLPPLIDVTPEKAS